MAVKVPYPLTRLRWPEFFWLVRCRHYRNKQACGWWYSCGLPWQLLHGSALPGVFGLAWPALEHMHEWTQELTHRLRCESEIAWECTVLVRCVYAWNSASEPREKTCISVSLTHIWQFCQVTSVVSRHACLLRKALWKSPVTNSAGLQRYQRRAENALSRGIYTFDIRQYLDMWAGWASTGTVLCWNL